MNIPRQRAAKTFVTTTRVDLRHLAKIAMFLKAHEYEISGDKSKSKLVTAAVQMIAEQLDQYEVEGTAQAMMILKTLGYGESMTKGRKDFRPIMEQLTKENLEFEASEQLQSSRPEDMKVATDFMQKIKKTHIPEDISQLPGIEAILAEEYPAEPVERPIEVPEDASKNKIHTHLRTEADEQNDLRQQKNAFGGPPPLAAEDEPEPSGPSEPSEH